MNGPHAGTEEIQSIYLHRNGPLLENDLDKPENRYGRYGFASFFLQFHKYCRGGWNQSFTLKDFFPCSLGGGGRYLSAPCGTSYFTILLHEALDRKIDLHISSHVMQHSHFHCVKSFFIGT